MNPRDSLNLLNEVAAQVNTNRQGHVNIQEAVMALRIFIEQHEPLEPSGEGASTPAKENPEKKGQKTPEEIAAEVRAKGEK